VRFRSRGERYQARRPWLTAGHSGSVTSISVLRRDHNGVFAHASRATMIVDRPLDYISGMRAQLRTHPRRERCRTSAVTTLPGQEGFWTIA
jgi:hypothetical protein